MSEKKTAFTTRLASSAAICGGFGAGPNLDPRALADEVFKGAPEGPWLCCYMLRRFGWPNSGSDDYKELCAWTLTTPMPGLYLRIDPYLGGSNLHFGVRFNKEVEQEVYRDPGRDAYSLRRVQAIEAWWKAVGRKLYTFGAGKKEGDEDELVKAYSTQNDMVSGLWKRTPRHKWGRVIPGGKKWRAMVIYWLGEFIEENHPEVKLPKMTKREMARRKTRFHLRINAAIKVTLRDLLRPTNVRDISFTPFGDIERTAEAIERFNGQKAAGYFEGAGYAPSYWYRKNQTSRTQPTQ